jgi:hypothetical protein
MAGIQGSVHTWVCGVKVLRACVTYLSAWLAAKLLENAYTENVYMKKIAPPALVGIVNWFVMFDLLAAGVIVATVAATMRMTTLPAATVAAFCTLSAADVLMEKTYLFVALMIVSAQVQSKKYFNYRYEGLRAVRAMRSIAFQVGAFTSLTPLYCIFAPRVLSSVH